MTRNEAVEIIEKYNESFEGGASIYEALKMAADALKDEDTVIDRVLEIIDTAHFDLDDSARERDVYMRVSEYRKWMKKAVMALKGGEQE